MYKKAALIFPLALISQLSLADWVKDAIQQNENQGHSIKTTHP